MLDVDPIPVEAAHLWEWWHQLNETRQAGFKLCHISYLELAAWAGVLHLRLSPFEVRCIMALDSCFLQWQDKTKAEADSTQTEQGKG